MANDPTDDNFEDADFEDLDPIEDDDLSDDLGGDDAWEDDASPEGDEDDLSGSDDDDAGAGGDDAPVKAKKPKKEKRVREPGEKSFVQKNFVMIVGAVVVVFGGVIGMSLMGGGSSAPKAPAESADALPEGTPGVTELAEGEEMPPMPAPISGEAPAATDDGGLTPMPTPEDLQKQDTELAELAIDEVPATPAAGTTKQGEAPFDFAEAEPPAEAPPVAEDVPVRPAVEAVQGTALELPEEIEEEKRTGKPVLNGAERMNMQFRKLAGTLPADVADATAPTIKEEKEEKQSEEALPPSLEQAAVPDLSPQLEEQKSQIDSLQGKLQDQQAAAEKSQQDLQASLSAKDDEIAKLQKSLKDLEAKLASAQSDADSAKDAAAKAKQDAKDAAAKADKAVKEAAKTPAPSLEPPAEEPEAVAEAEPEPAPAPAPKKSAPKPAAEPREAAPVVAKVLSWELKGASNGKAVLSSKTNGDTRNVAVGDSVEGLGKITMIAKENGRWTVKGTKGSVVR